MSEIWKTIEGYPTYEVSNQGRVKNATTNYLLRASLNSGGYEKVNLNKNIGAQFENHIVHILVAKAFIPNPNERPEVDHIDRNKTNNTVKNLRWLTIQQNGFNTNAKGYYFDKSRGSYRAQIVLGGKRINLGYFTTEQAARDAYLAAKKIYHVINEPITEKIVVKVTLKASSPSP